MISAINKIKHFFKNVQQNKFKHQLLTLMNPKRRPNQSTFLISEKEKEFLKIPLIYDQLTEKKRKENPYFIVLEEKFIAESIQYECVNYFDPYPFLKIRIKILYFMR